MAVSPDHRPDDSKKAHLDSDGASTDAGKTRTAWSDFASKALTTPQQNAGLRDSGKTPDSGGYVQLAENIIGSAAVNNPFIVTPRSGLRSEAPTYDKPGNEVTNPFDPSVKHQEVAKPPALPVLEHPRFETKPPVNAEAETYKFRSPGNGSGQRTGADVVVRVPENFDPSKPIHMVVYNHGFYDTASSAYSHAELDKQMKDAPPNTVLVVPEWQTNPSEKNSNRGTFGEKDQFKHLVNDAFAHIPELKGKTLDSVDSVHLISHSAGYKGLEPELYNNGIENKVKSITMLDSLYNPTDLDPWLKKNIHALADGNKQYVNVSNPGEDSTYAASRDQATRVKGWLAEARLGRSNVYEDYTQTGSVVGVDKLQKYPMVFKLSEVQDGGRKQHMALPNLYVHRVLQVDDF